MSREDVVNKVRGLLAKANDEAATEAEREAFMQGAARVMAKHQIEQGELKESGPIEDRLVERSSLGNLAKAVEFLWSEVGDYYGCTVLGFSHQGRGNVKMHIFGPPSSMDMVESVADLLAWQLTTAVAFYRPRSRKSFGVGWVASVSATLKSTREIVMSESMSLVPTSTASMEAAEQYYGGGIKSSESSSELDGWDLSAGRMAGKHADVGMTKVEGN